MEDIYNSYFKNQTETLFQGRKTFLLTYLMLYLISVIS